MFRTLLHVNEASIYWCWDSNSLQDEEKFFSDYAESHKKLSELGCKATSPAFAAESASSKSAIEAYQGTSALLGQATVGVVVAGLVVALSYLYETKRKIIK